MKKKILLANMTKNLIFKAYVNLEFQYIFFPIIFLTSPFKSVIGYCQICSVTYTVFILISLGI